jgi:archaemetzincin
MANQIIWLLAILMIATVATVSHSEPPGRENQLRKATEKLRPLHMRLGRPRPGDWLDQHPEPGQTFSQYVASNPVIPTTRRRVIYVQPLGDFSKTQRKIIILTVDFMGRYFGLPVKVQEDIPLSVLPGTARRVHPSWGDRQILTTYVLERVLRPALPGDAVAYIAFTTSDLWPGRGWNFVFGQASLRERVGVWSIYRNGNPDASADAFRLCLLRTIKTATHEMGHMLSMLHCTAYECNMCGSNHREESDRRPLALCPECVAKIWWAARTDPIERYRKLAAFCRAHGLEAEQRFYEKSLDALTSDRHGSEPH